MTKILGLDLGTNSIGWALFDVNETETDGSLIDAGARIFIEAVDAKTRVPKNLARRTARMQRRQLARRRARRRQLKNFLVRNHLLPASEEEQNQLFFREGEEGPYALRKRGLDEQLTPHQFGRVLYHLNQRRGFKSNRKAQLGELLSDPTIRAFAEAEEREAKPSNKEESEYLQRLASLKDALASGTARTLGEYLAEQSKKRATFVTERSMYVEEFEKLWAVQCQFHPALLTEDAKASIFRILFFQRPLKKQKFLVGRCTLEPSRKRAPSASLVAQQFRVYQDVNNMAVRDPISRNSRPLRRAEREKLITALFLKPKLTWTQVRSAKFLGLHSGEKINLEEGDRPDLPGASTYVKLEKLVPSLWQSLDDAGKEELVTDLLTIDRIDSLLTRLQKHWKLEPRAAYDLATTEFEAGYSSLSRRAMYRMLVHLKDGKNYHDSLIAAGYKRRDQLERKALDRLPPPPKLKNPIVDRALNELRKVMNTLVRTYGKPDVVRIELARDMKQSKRERDRHTKQMRENEKANREADAQAQLVGIAQPTHDDRLKYRLWKETGGCCAYSGDVIGIESLFSHRVDIDHIIPFSRCIDDSYINKTICFSEINSKVKKNKTPFEAFSGNSNHYASILQRLDRMTQMPLAKKRLFEQQEVNIDNFLNKQLSDTRYICRAAKDYVASLGCATDVGKGQATAALRRKWDLNRLLPRGSGDSKERSDHRHHVIDAAVVAVTSRSLFHRMSSISAKFGSEGLNDVDLPPPWTGFQSQLRERLDTLVVSHAATRKISDALHEDTSYGLDSGKGCYLYRKPLDEQFRSAAVESIRDEKVKQIVKARLEAHGGNAKAAFATPLFHVDGKTPIKSVRLTRQFDNRSVFKVLTDKKQQFKFFKFGNNHHVEIIEDVSTGKRTGKFVTTLEAARRARIAKEPIVKREHGEGKRFIMSLGINDVVLLEVGGNTPAPYRVQVLKGTNGVIELQKVEASLSSDTAAIQRRTPNSLKGKKVTLDAIGRIYDCHD